MTMHEIRFSVTGVAKQTIKIVDDNFTIENITKKLNSGELVTTTWFDVNEEKFKPAITALNDDAVIALIEVQEIEGEYFDFEVKY